MRAAIRTPLGQLTVALTAVVVAVIVVVALAYVSFAHQQDRIAALGARGDCRSEISAAFAEVERAKGEAADSASETLITVVFNHQPQGTPLTADETGQIVDAYTQASDAADAFNALPSVPHAVDHGYTLDGVAHAPCPTVG